MGNMRTIIEQIISEFNNPFKDPRQARIPGITNKSPSISNERLFYLLIDETPRTFKKGLIVTATVTKVLDTKVICRLENGLNAIILQQAILEDSNEKLKDIVEIGHIVTGRIDKINTEDDKRFEVNLHCKKKDL
jgi:transcriptional accessory protein Tex/SPT6